MIAEPLVELDGSLNGTDNSRYRRLFYQLINAESFPSVAAAAKTEVECCFDKIGRNKADSSDREIDQTVLLPHFDARAKKNLPTTHRLDDRQRAYILRQFAPLALTEASWLNTSFQAANGHSEVSAHLFRIYSRLNSDGAGGRTTSRYRALMLQDGLSMPGIYTQIFCQQQSLHDTSFRVAVVQLCLALWSRTYLAEILGYTLAHAYESPLLAFIAWLNKTHDVDRVTLGEGASLFAGVNTDLRTISLDAVSAYIGAFDDQAKISHQYRRIWSGIRLYEILNDSFWAQLEVQLHHPPNVAADVLRVLRQKANYAQGYHRSVCVGDKTLDEWFATGLSNGEEFLRALAASNYFNTDHPEDSPFVKQLTGPEGPMFGVFTQSEIELIVQWLSSASHRPAPESLVCTEALNLSVNLLEPNARIEKLSKRELYYRLVNVDLHRDVLPSAKSLVARILRAAERWSGFSRAKGLPWFAYSHDRFNQHIERLYRNEMDAYQPVSGHPCFSKDVYVWGVEQFAPTLLVDGCWLQNTGRVMDTNPEIAERLGSIYADEIGNGQPFENHPNIYRRLLASQQIQLPQFDTPEFSQHAGFMDSAFDLPVYLLAISQFPQSYLPEILGLNMAIELSGLGAGYLRLAESLEYWGIDARIVRVHLSIDNLASGHSAIARQAIGLYLDQVRLNGGETAVQRHWRRIWIGFISLGSVPRVFKYALVWNYFLRFGLKRLSDRR